MPTASNVFEELKQALDKFKAFLDTNTDIIVPVVHALKPIVPIIDLIEKLIALMTKIKTEITTGDVGTGITKVTDFTNAAKAVLEAAKKLVPDATAPVDEALTIVTGVSDLPGQIVGVIDDINENLAKLKAA